ncbi:MAG: hypothetical protein ACKV19_08370 [Verrucomicrobiales bacterium]
MKSFVPWTIPSFLVAASLWADPVAERQGKILEQNRSALHHSEVGQAEPMAKLPAHAPAPEGKLSLWADFKTAGETLNVPLYVINSTDQPITFVTEGLDLGAKFEFQDGAAWRRAQAFGLMSWCGDGAIPVSLPAGHFFKLRGYRPVTGRVGTVRYAIRDKSLASNEAPGLVSDHDLRAVAWDPVTENDIPLETRLALHFNPDAPLPARPEAPRLIAAIRALRRYPVNEPALERVQMIRSHIDSFPAGKEREALNRAANDYLESVEEQANPPSQPSKKQQSEKKTPSRGQKP